MRLAPLFLKALVTTIALAPVASAHSQRRARRQDGVEARQLPGLPHPILPTTRLLSPSVLEPIVSPLGELASTVVPGGITLLPAVNTLVSQVASILSPALPILSPALSLVTQLLPVSDSGGTGDTRTGFTTRAKPSCTGVIATVTRTKTVDITITRYATLTRHTTVTRYVEATRKAAVSHRPKTSVCHKEPIPHTYEAVTSHRPTANVPHKHKHKPKPRTACLAPTRAPTVTVYAHPTATPACIGILPCILEPIASIVIAIVPPLPTLPAVNELVSHVAAAVTLAVPELSTFKEVIDQILPV